MTNLQQQFGPKATRVQQFVMQIGASTTPPTKGTVDHDLATISRWGNLALIQYAYQQTAPGADGTGTYRFQMPGALKIDVSRIQVASALSATILGPAYYSASVSSVRRAGQVIAVDADNMELILPVSFAVMSIVGSTFLPLGDAGSVSYSFSAIVPVL